MQMKNYSFLFDNNKFDIDFIPQKSNVAYYELKITQKELYILTPINAKSNNILKIFYPYSKYKSALKEIKSKILWQFLLTSIISILISIGFSFYILKPLRESLQLLEVFIKDIIHDLNTPLTNILINLKIIGRNPSIQEEIDGIEQSAKNISMLHTNLNSYLQNFTYVQNRFNLKNNIESQINFFKPSYSYLKWEIDLDDCIVSSDENAVARVI
jgi:two-component system OmpR family sensor kinase